MSLSEPSLVTPDTVARGSVLVWTTETPQRPACAPPAPTIYVICRTCFYEKELGQRCGLPCV